MNFPLRLENIEKRYGIFSIEGLNLEIAPGEGFSLLGPSGCGKSTTLRMIGGFETPDKGKIFHGNEITNLPPQKRNIRTVFQKYALFPHLTVKENIAFGLRMQKKSEAEIQKKISWAFEILEMQRLAQRSVQQLSGGEQQRVALARALVTEPSVLLLDEPLSALDLKLREKMQLELLSLRKKLGATFLFVTHDQNEAMTISDRIGIMKQGKLLQSGTAEDIYQRPSCKFVAEFIGQANFLSPHEITKASGEKSHLVPSKEWMLRPEHFKMESLQWQPKEDSLGFKAKILESVFLGAERLSKLEDETGKTYLVKSYGTHPSLKINENIFLTWSARNLWPIADS